jgi:hypothetical protein
MFLIARRETANEVGEREVGVKLDLRATVALKLIFHREQEVQVLIAHM